MKYVKKKTSVYTRSDVKRADFIMKNQHISYVRRSGDSGLFACVSTYEIKT